MIQTIQRDITERFHVKGSRAADAIPDAAGAYLILIASKEEVSLPLPSLRTPCLPAGYYVYAGSARGPGGLRARIARHLRRDKKPHWHVDYLTTVSEALLAFPIPGGSECALVQTLIQSGAYHPPAPGFGSSDCKRCISHLLAARPINQGVARCQ